MTTDPPPEWEGFLLTDFPDFVFADFMLADFFGFTDFIDFPTDPMQEVMKTTCAQVLNKQASKQASKFVLVGV